MTFVFDSETADLFSNQRFKEGYVHANQPKLSAVSLILCVCVCLLVLNCINKIRW